MTLRIVQSVVTTLSLLVRLRRDFSSPSAKQSAMCSRNSLVARLKKSRTHLLHFWKSLPLTYTAIIPPRPNTATSNVLRNTKSKQHPCTLPAWRTSILLQSWASPRRLRASQTMQCQRISFFFPSVSFKIGYLSTLGRRAVFWAGLVVTVVFICRDSPGDESSLDSNVSVCESRGGRERNPCTLRDDALSRCCTQWPGRRFAPPLRGAFKCFQTSAAWRKRYGRDKIGTGT